MNIILLFSLINTYTGLLVISITRNYADKKYLDGKVKLTVNSCDKLFCELAKIGAPSGQLRNDMAKIRA